MLKKCSLFWIRIAKFTAWKFLGSSLSISKANEKKLGQIKHLKCVTSKSIWNYYWRPNVMWSFWICYITEPNTILTIWKSFGLIFQLLINSEFSSLQPPLFSKYLPNYMLHNLMWNVSPKILRIAQTKPTANKASIYFQSYKYQSVMYSNIFYRSNIELPMISTFPKLNWITFVIMKRITAQTS